MKKIFKNASIRSKLLMSHLLLIAIPTIVITIFFYRHIYNLIVNDTIRQEQALAQQTSSTLTATLESISAVTTSIRGNAYLASIINSAGNRDTMQKILDKRTEADAFRAAVETQTDHELITSIRIYSDEFPEEMCDGKEFGDIFHRTSDVNGSYWKGIFAGSSKYSLYCPSFYLTSKEISSCGDLAYIEKLFIGKTPDDKPCYLAVYFSSDKLRDILTKGISIHNSVMYIINERDSLVATSDKALSGTYRMDYETVQNIGQSYDGFTTRTVLDREVYTGCYRLENSDWYMVSILPAAPVLKKGNNIIATFFGLYLILLAVAFIIAYTLSQSITKRVDALGDQMKTVRNGPPVRTADPEIHDEIGDLVDNYNYMSDQMNQLIADKEVAAEELRISEIRALQAQINPHFLYNTMEMINWLSQTGKQREVTDAIQALSKFYKLTLSKKDIFGTIASETEHVTLYVQLENMRHDNRIHLVVDIPDELNDYRIPKLTFQPVVENSIQHGIFEKASAEGTIVITGWIENMDLIIQISDDGVGIPEDQIGTILTGEGKSTGNGSNIGIYNTHRRIQAIYGEGYGLHYSSIYGKGTDVEIRFPLNTDT